MNIADSLLEMAKITRGRIHPREVFRDFMAFSAIHLSNQTDPIHMNERKEQQTAVVKRYEPQEIHVFRQTLQELTAEIGHNLEIGKYIDFLGPVHQQLHPKGGPLKQNFTPPDVAILLSRLAVGIRKLPEEGYFTYMEPACGSGVLCLAFAEELANQGFNPCEQLVIQASDLDSLCVHMTYLQLSLYGIPAVIIQGDTISLEEYDRWYTPLYILRNWVWREPMPFCPGRNKDDELLKMICEPIYAKARLLESLIKPMDQKEVLHEL